LKEECLPRNNMEIQELCIADQELDFLEEKRTHKKKHLVQSPNSYFMDLKCPGCYKITTIFSHAQTASTTAASDSDGYTYIQGIKPRVTDTKNELTFEILIDWSLSFQIHCVNTHHGVPQEPGRKRKVLLRIMGKAKLGIAVCLIPSGNTRKVQDC
ncbi:hypothetical protein E2I00_004377, partial [Balaenoptera physalus]